MGLNIIINIFIIHTISIIAIAVDSHHDQPPIESALTVAQGFSTAGGRVGVLEASQVRDGGIEEGKEKDGGKLEES